MNGGVEEEDRMSGRFSRGSQKGYSLQDKPREGSRLRKMWDYLHDHKGEFVTLNGVVPPKQARGTALRDLVDQYNLDIRVHKWGRGRGKGADATYCLVGEWDGKVYIDYVAERINNGTSS